MNIKPFIAAPNAVHTTVAVASGNPIMPQGLQGLQSVQGVQGVAESEIPLQDTVETEHQEGGE